MFFNGLFDSQPCVMASMTIDPKIIKSELVSGLSYYPDFISREEEIELLEIINQQPWLTDLKRRVQHYGYKYDYKAKALNQDMWLGSIPDWANKLALHLVNCGIMEQMPDQLIINEYTPGQGISSHVDCEPCFGDTVVSLSLASMCIMDFTHIGSKKRLEAILDRRSIVCMKGESRYEWMHGIIPRLADTIAGVRVNRHTRVSMTFRKVLLDNNFTKSHR